MTLEIDCTTRMKQICTLSVETLYRTRVRKLGPMLVPSVNSIVRIVTVTWKLQSLAATAAAREVHWETQYDPLAHVHGEAHHAHAFRSGIICFRTTVAAVF